MLEISSVNYVGYVFVNIFDTGFFYEEMAESRSSENCLALS